MSDETTSGATEFDGMVPFFPVQRFDGNGECTENDAETITEAEGTPPSDMPLDELRRGLVTALDVLRDAEHVIVSVKAQAESGIIADSAAWSTCKNEGERARFLAARLADHEDYQAAAEDVNLCQMEVDIFRAEIQIREDARRERQMAQRDRELELQAEALALEARKLDIQAEAETRTAAILEGMRERFSERLTGSLRRAAERGVVKGAEAANGETVQP